MKPPILDPFIYSILLAKGQSKLIGEDKILSESFTKAMDVLGPIGKIWLAVGDFTNNPCEETSIDVEMVQSQSVGSL